MTNHSTPQASTQSQAVKSSASILYAASVSLTLFWVLIIVKESNASVNTFLNIHKGVGPLLSLFVISILALIVGYVLAMGLLHKAKLDGQKQLKRAFWVLIIAVIIFTFMTAPPFFQPIVEILP